MRTIGMLGGMSWESTSEYYRLANEAVRERLGGLHSASVLVSSVDFADIERMQAEGRWDDAGRLLAARARDLESGGADIVLLCTNTMHKVIAPVVAAVSVPVLDIVDVTTEAVRSAGLERVGLLGTRFTMEDGFYSDRLRDAGVVPVVPDAADRELVHRVIYEELCLGVMREESRQAFREVIARLVAQDAEGILLACTEIELLIGASDSPVPVFPTTRLHVEAAVAYALAEPAAPAPVTPASPVLRQTVLDAVDVRALAEFYRALFGWRYRAGDEAPSEGPDTADWLVLVDADGVPRLAFQQVDSLTPTTWPDPDVPMQLHLDCTVPTEADLEAAHDQALALGARVLHDRSDDPDERLWVFADPAGHPFCIFVA